MFSLLFGLHFALRALIDWVLQDDNRDGKLKNDRVAVDLQNEKHHTIDGQLTVGRYIKGRKAYIFGDESAGFKDEHQSKNKSQKDFTLIESKSNNSSSSNGREDVPVIEQTFISQYVEGAQSSKNLSRVKDSNNVDVVVPLKVSQLSSVVTTKEEVIPRQQVEVLRSRTQALPKSNSTYNVEAPDSTSTDDGEVTVPLKDTTLSTVDAKQDVKKSVDVTKVYGYQEMPYLSDEVTVNYIKQSHTMFIMRGLPGSGKSTLVKCLQEVYKERVVVCSADDFFYYSDGTYNFDAGKLSEAHKFCQDKAAYHCDEGVPVVIIDNTNIQRWAMSFYVKLAQSRCYYHVVIVEPLTPWRYDPDELALRNKHNVDRDLISKKLKSLRDSLYRPLYYGWFICKEDSRLLVKKSREVLKQCLDEILWPSLNAEDVSDSFASLEEILGNVVISYTDPVPMLHCTAAYLARRSKDSYHTMEAVVQSLGKSFCLCISGFVYSKQAISARVALLENTNEAGINGSKLSDLEVDSPTFGAEGVVNDTNVIAKLYMKNEEEKLREKYSDVNLHSSDSQVKHSLFHHGCSAHITISYASDGQSKLSGENLLNILELEFYGKVKQQRSKVGLVSAYGNDMFQIQLKEPIEVRSLFHGFYSGRG